MIVVADDRLRVPIAVALRRFARELERDGLAVPAGLLEVAEALDGRNERNRERNAADRARRLAAERQRRYGQRKRERDETGQRSA